MAANPSITLEGVLKADGTIAFGSRPSLPPGRVRVWMQALPGNDSRKAPLPDGLHDEPMLDPWAELPVPEGKLVGFSELGDVPLPDPPEIPDDSVQP